MIRLTLIIAALAIVPHFGPVETRVDVVEISHFFDENGRLVFDQVIFLDWSDDACRHQVRAWRLLKTPDQWPLRDSHRGGHVSVWLDGDVFRVVRSGSVRESWSQRDPELLERTMLPREERRELGGLR